MTRRWLAATALLCGLAGCSGSKDKGSAGGSAGSAGSATAATSNVVSGIPLGPIPVTLPAVKAPHAVVVTEAKTFVVIDDKGTMTHGPIAPGTAPYAGTAYEPSKVQPGQSLDDAADAVPMFAPTIEPVGLHARIVGPGPVDVLVLADGRASATALINNAGFKDRRAGIAVAGPSGIARLDLLMIDRWAPPVDAVHISVNAKDARIARGYDAVAKAPRIPVDDLAASLTTLIAEAKDKPPFVVLDVESGLTVDALIAMLGMIVEKGVTEIDIRSAEAGHDEIYGELLEGAEMPGGRQTTVQATSVAMTFEINGPADGFAAIAKRYVRRNISKLLLCYQQVLATKPTIGGTLRLNFVIVGTGGVPVKLTADGIDPAVSTCARNAFSTIEFPVPPKSGSRVVEATFSLAPP